MEPKIPEAFDDICALFYQGVTRQHPTMRDVVAWVLSGQSRQNLEAAKAFLDELLSGKYDKEQLMAIWGRTRSDVAIFDGTDEHSKESGVVYFLKMMRSMIEQKLAE